nr:ephrin type-B receptor [Tanacetum cinerariifolium]
MSNKHIHYFIIIITLITNPNFVVSANSIDFTGDYSPPSPPPPSPPPHPPSLSCESDLRGIGSLDSTCEVNTSLDFSTDVYIEGLGSLVLLPNVRLACGVVSCEILVNVSREFRLGKDSIILGGTVRVAAGNVTFAEGSVVNVTSLGGDPPEYTSGTPKGVLGGGGGYGGRGACCVVDNTKLPEDVWGGDAYGWSDLSVPFSYGSRGGTTSKDEEYGGNGGGRVWVEAVNTVDVSGGVYADGGDGGVKGGGGSGGSIYVKARKMTGGGILSASGGNGFAGGAGGRISVNVFSRRDDQTFFAHGAAGTFYDTVPRKLIVNNHNMSTNTDTPFFAFPNQPRWTSVDIQEYARATVPLRWSRVQVVKMFT